jgi:hypothetical protein
MPGTCAVSGAAPKTRPVGNQEIPSTNSTKAQTTSLPGQAGSVTAKRVCARSLVCTDCCYGEAAAQLGCIDGLTVLQQLALIPSG